MLLNGLLSSPSPSFGMLVKKSEYGSSYGIGGGLDGPAP